MLQLHCPRLRKHWEIAESRIYDFVLKLSELRRVPFSLLHYTFYDQLPLAAIALL
jgi:hypothetical protein